MKKYKKEDIPEFFRFTIKNDSDNIVRYAIYPKDVGGIEDSNLIFSGWNSKGEPVAKSHLTYNVLEMLNDGTWIIVN